METQSVNLCAELGETTQAIPPNGEDSDLQQDSPIADGSPAPNAADRDWKQQLDKFKRRIEALQETYEQSYWEIGKLLIQAQGVYKGHGSWIKWLKENVPFSVRHVQRLIRVAEMFGDATLVSQLGLTSSKAYALTRISKNDLNDFLNTFSTVGGKRKSIEDLTKRELELEVTAFLRGKLVTLNHEGVTSNQGRKTPKESIETNLKKLEEILGRTVASIKGSNIDTRESWISKLEELYLMGLEELTPTSE